MPTWRVELTTGESVEVRAAKVRSRRIGVVFEDEQKQWVQTFRKEAIQSITLLKEMPTPPPPPKQQF